MQRSLRSAWLLGLASQRICKLICASRRRRLVLI